MTSELMLLEAKFPLEILVGSSIFGLIIGSFLNVVSYRLPMMLQKNWETQARQLLNMGNTRPANNKPFNLWVPNSHCPHCDHHLKPWENVPVVSYFLLKGRCAHCKNPISIRYPFIELLTATLTTIVIIELGLNLTGLLGCILTWSLITLAVIDYDHMILPDDITLPIFWLGLAINYFDIITVFSDAFFGAIAGYLTLWVVYQAFKFITGKEGMGFGDFKLLALLGAWLGWQMLPLIVVLASCVGALVGGALIALGRDRNQPIPFGPYLAVAGWVALIWGNQIIRIYLELTSWYW